MEIPVNSRAPELHREKRRWWRISPVGLYVLLLAGFGCVYFYVGQFQLLGGGDEAAIVDPAIQLARGGKFSIPSAGPGAGHEEAYFYQTPLHSLVLAGWFCIFGVTLRVAHALSLVLAVGCLIAVLLFRKVQGGLFCLLAATVLAFDTGFASRSALVRYDHLAILFVLSAVALAFSFQEGFPKWRRWFFAGVLLGAAAMTNFLYCLYLPAIALTIVTLAVTGRQTWRSAGYLLVVLLAGFTVSLLPWFCYILQHPAAFQEQFLFQILRHRERVDFGTHAPLGFWEAELRRYAIYYKNRFFVVPLFVVSLAISAQACSKRWRLSEVACSFLLLAPCVSVFLAVASGGKSWHQLVAVPAWALLVAGAGKQVVESIRSKSHAVSFMLSRLWIWLATLVAANALFMDWGRNASQVMIEQGRRNLAPLEAWASPHIPRGARVYGDRRLVFLAAERDWRFVGDYGGLFNTSDLLKDREVRPDWIVLYDGAPRPAWFRQEEWTEVAQYSEARPLTGRMAMAAATLESIFRYNSPPRSARIWRRQPQGRAVARRTSGWSGTLLLLQPSI